MKELMQEPNWMLLTLIGAFLGYLLPFAIKSLRYIYRHLFCVSAIEGKWFGYYMIYEDGEVNLREEEWFINIGFDDRLRVQIKVLQHNSLNYVGNIIEERGQLSVALKAKEHKEHVYCRFTSPIPGNDELLKGFWLGQDFDGFPVVGAEILSRKSLEKRKSFEIFERSYVQDHNKRIFRLK